MRFVLLPLLLLAACTTKITERDDDDDQGGVCSAYDDQTAAGTTLIRFRNNSGEPVYLPGSCGNVVYDVTSVDDPASASYGYDSTCLTTCEDLQSGGVIECGACAPTVFLVPPAGTLDVTWDGTGLAPRNMPSVCFQNHDQGDSCQQIVAAPNGSYRIGATIHSDCEGFDGGECACDAETGMCTGDPAGVQTTVIPVDVSFPSAAVVEVVFDVCVFGCAEG